jgi:hypothetical protein
LDASRNDNRTPVRDGIDTSTAGCLVQPENGPAPHRSMEETMSTANPFTHLRSLPTCAIARNKDYF